jgi:hypothetical protein
MATMPAPATWVTPSMVNSSSPSMSSYTSSSGMEVLVNGRSLFKVVVRERHVLGMEIASVPAGQALPDREFVGVQKGHRFLVVGNHRAVRTAPWRGGVCG